MSKLLLILISITFAMACSTSDSALTYYIDGEHGDDDHHGKTAKKPWKTLSKIDSLDLQPGSQVLLKKGLIYKGSMRFDAKDSGSAGNPIRIGSYGHVSLRKPVIESDAAAAIYLNKTNHVQISGLVLRGAGRKNGNHTSGIIADSCGNISIDSVEVSGYQKFGINILSSTEVKITNVLAHNNGHTGIRTGASDGNMAMFPCRNIYIGYCRAENNPGDPSVLDNHSGSGIIISKADSAIVEYCVATNNGWDMPRTGNGPVGIWAHDANNVTIQYCISHNNQAPRGAWDGGGFDFDGGVTNSVMQFNYSYDNNGAGYGLFQYAGTTVWENNIVRYNISYNDGDGNDKAGIYIWTAEPEKDLLRNCMIYNNVIVNEFGYAVKFASGNDGNFSNPKGFEFYNNIFVAGEALVSGEYSNSIFSHNAWWHIKGKPIGKSTDANGHYGDPCIIMPGPDNYRITDPEKLSEMEVFRLLENSPCKGSGKVIANNGGFNFGGDSIGIPPDIGAF